jgi:hypothetical protein
MTKLGTFILGFFGIVGGLGGCAYRVAKQDVAIVKESDAHSIFRVFVPVFDNMTTRGASSEAQITEAFRSRWARIPNVRVVESSADADFILAGRIRKWNVQGGNDLFTGTSSTEALGGLTALQSTVASLVVSLEIELEFLRKLDGANKVEWSRNVKGSKSFEAYSRLDEDSGSSSAPMIHDSRERLVIRRLADDLAARSIDALKETF